MCIRDSVGGGEFNQLSRCVAAGEQFLALDGELSSGGSVSSAVVGGRVSSVGGGAEAGVVVDLFEAGADGSRAGWLGATSSGVDGSYRFDVDQGCYVVTMIAPSGRTFVGGGEYSQLSRCVAAGETFNQLDGQLA